MTLGRFLAAVTIPFLALGAAVAACSAAGDSTDGGSADAADAADAGTDRLSDRTSHGDRRDAARRDDERADPEAGAARLSFLRVSSTDGTDGSSSLTLTPAFAPDIFDYYVRCAAGSNDLTVSMTAAEGAQSLLIQPAPPSSVLPKQTLSISVMDNQAIVAAATNSVATTEYWVRCLPPDFPELQWSPHPEAGTPTPGYYLVDDMFLLVGEGGYAIVLDSHGVPVWYERAYQGNYLSDLDVIDGGGGVSFIQFPKVDWFVVRQLDPNQTQFSAPTNAFLGLHEVRMLPNGNYLGLTIPTRGPFDLTGLDVHVDGGLYPLGPDASIQECQIVEFQPDGTPVWIWNASDHLDPVAVSVSAWPAGFPAKGLVVDVFHCNAIDVDPANGNLLVSARDTDSVFYIDRSTSKILWKMGGASATKDDAVYVPVPDAFHRQHDARLRPGWKETCSGATGQISMFDDESTEPRAARGVVFDVVVGAPDGGGDCGAPSEAGASGAKVSWHFWGSVNSSGMGSFRIYSDGSRLIGWGTRATDKTTFTEVDVHGHAMLDFTMDPLLGNSSYRAIKVPLSDFDLDVMRATAGGGTERAPPTPGDL